MAQRSASARRQSYRYRSSNIRQMYVYGNTVTKPEYEPEPRVQRPKRSPKASRQVRKNQRNALRMNRAYVGFLTAAAVLILAVCVNYVQMRSEIMDRSENITAMQRELTELKEENNTKYNALMDSVNLEEVRNRAVNQLGMGYAAKEQIVEYDNPTGDYIKQYEEIPADGVLASSADVSD